ncbi:histidine phosphatase family protein [Streptococcus constellatus subsp. pharyngis]|uniref:Phosphoglycerate mutase family protein n=1 Tax=Streptococcus constellatus subsp. pharyngis SK1060 = CCUG 46377 TaxID=1035184 RepID=F9P5F9_STRCV|nr:histidine phosphatase family protein [Streptococcus constellatus]AGU72536.1 putative phosphoglycerate mutase [Streptococcus constellatus subsp. pharyngis C232]AGU74292.1 putative phosphoglycerate mutase [Streptococcus constellatus subsp. pharyngis C818]AGU79660.1 putative phosphoglycerate mutase [Streptococcus constellatus subsp. pharyngis C1050]EGV10467.1 phosphoglycerate mutase family protein [Streptococcus constellatus subsp. pharyngis SK1060 = CCUG 46377]QRP81974.1 histidine phosphatase
MKILFVRHGKDSAQHRGGWSQLDLLPEGKREAEALADYLAQHKEDYHFTKIITSDLKRAETTATILAETLQLPLEKERDLRETNNGDLAGMLNSEADQKFPHLYFRSLAMDEHYPNGESSIEFYQRIKTWFQLFLQENNDSAETQIVVTHGGVINIIYHLVNKREWTNKSRLFLVKHCSISLVNTETLVFEIENQTDFLKEK